MTEPQWDLMVRRASNGFVVRGWKWDGDAHWADTLIEDDPANPASLRLLWEVIEQMGFTGSRHDAKRIFVGFRPGDKHHDLHPKPCAECECKCDPDQSTPEED